MATFRNATKKYVQEDVITGVEEFIWDSEWEIGESVPLSGIYRCNGCGREITSNIGDPFPPQNKHQHPENCKVAWKLIVRTDT